MNRVKTQDVSADNGLDNAASPVRQRFENLAAKALKDTTEQQSRLTS
jgi:hypothetical protein